MAEVITEQKVLVYGATGSQAKPVATKLLEAGRSVRVVTRDPGKAGDLERAGAEVLEGDMADLERLKEVSAGVDAVFLLIPFFTQGPTDGVTYGKNAIDAAKAAGVDLLVWNTSGEIPPQRSGNSGFDVRLDVLEHLEASGLPHVVLQPTAYMENFLGPWTRSEIAEEDVFAYPTPDAVQMQWVATDDVASFAVYALEHPELADLNVKVCGPERLNGTGVAERFSRGLGREVTFRAMPASEFGEKIDAVFPGMGESAAQGYAAAYEYPEMFSSNVNLDAALERMPVELTSLETWVRQHAEAFQKQAVK